ncbi:MAG: hypothetical protein ACH344_10840 [Yersinia sp. (in: enterobacteria)]
MRVGKKLLLTIILIFVGAFLFYSYGDMLNLGGVKNSQAALNHWVVAKPLLSGGVFFCCMC